MKKYKIRLKISSLIIAAFISIAGIYGCGDTTTVSTTQADNLSFSATGSQDSIGDYQNVLILDTVKILIKDIKVKVSNINEDSGAGRCRSCRTCAPRRAGRSSGTPSASGRPGCCGPPGTGCGARRHA